MKVYLAADHGGLTLKNKLVSYIKSLGYDTEDLGPEVYNPTDDYPIFAEKLAKKVSQEEGSLGVLACRNGVGMIVACNKVDGARCALSWNPKHAQSARTDDDVNILSLPADYITEKQAEDVVKAFLSTKFEPKERYVRRVHEIKEIEEEKKQ